jgi:hypothetical protein
MNTASKRAQKVSNDALEQAAQSGVARAIAARQAAGVELTAADVGQVSGGLFPIIRQGGIPVDPWLAGGPAVNPVLPTVQGLGAGAGAVQGIGMVA